MAGFTLTSSSFQDGGAIPTRHTCDGQDVSPALAWEGAPAGTAAFALIVDDPDARGFVHWVAFNLAGGPSGDLAEAQPAKAFFGQGRNDFGRVGYGGPCPPAGTHRYRFTLFALSQPLVLSGEPAANELRAAMTVGVLLGQTTLTGTYARRR
jgi:hypothetical protein